MTAEQFQMVAAAVSITLGIVAIALSFAFYVLSNKIGKETTKAAEDAQRNLAAITELYERFYKDTFGMMRESVSFVQDRLVGGGEAGDEATTQIEERVSQVEQRVEEGFDGVFQTLATQKELTEKDLHELRSRLIDVAGTAVRETAADEQQDRLNSARNAILPALLSEGVLTLSSLYKRIRADEVDATPSDMFRALEQLRQEGTVVWDGQKAARTIVTITPGGMRGSRE